MRRWGAIARYGPLGSGVGAPGEVNKVDWEHSGGEGWFFPERFEWWHGGFVRKLAHVAGFFGDNFTYRLFFYDKGTWLIGRPC